MTIEPTTRAGRSSFSLSLEPIREEGCADYLKKLKPNCSDETLFDFCTTVRNELDDEEIEPFFKGVEVGFKQRIFACLCPIYLGQNNFIVAGLLAEKTESQSIKSALWSQISIRYAECDQQAEARASLSKARACWVDDPNTNEMFEDAAIGCMKFTSFTDMQPILNGYCANSWSQRLVNYWLILDKVDEAVKIWQQVTPGEGFVEMTEKLRDYFVDYGYFDMDSLVDTADSTALTIEKELTAGNLEVALKLWDGAQAGRNKASQYFATYFTKRLKSNE